MGGRGEWSVGEDHGVVDDERLVLVRVHEVANEINTDIRGKRAFRKRGGLSVDIKLRIHETIIGSVRAFGSSDRVLPEAGLIKSEMLRCVRLSAELPLASDAGRIAALLEQVGKGRLLSI